MKRDRSKVVSRKVTRWYIGGRGYNSELAAYMQIAKRHVEDLYWSHWHSIRPTGGFDLTEATERRCQWYSARYPSQPECHCAYCSFHQRDKVRRYGANSGCWLAKMADYRKIAREIMSGERDHRGNKVLALPEFVEKGAVVDDLTGRELTGRTTGPLPYNATQAQVDQALEAVTNSETDRG